MSDLSSFVRARVSEDEAVARGASARPQPHRDLWVSDYPDGQLGISRARMRVEIESKRRLIALADAAGDDHILRVLAMVYDDHTDWQPEWRVHSTVEDTIIAPQFD